MTALFRGKSDPLYLSLTDSFRITRVAVGPVIASWLGLRHGGQ